MISPRVMHALDPKEQISGSEEQISMTMSLSASSGVSYGEHNEAWQTFESQVRTLIAAHGCRSICDVGGGANPLLSYEFIHSRGIDYTLLDISAAELAKAPPGFTTLVADVCDSNLTSQAAGRFDLVFSKMVAEHVVSGEQFHRNVFELLAPGGLAFHFFPTLYCPPFLVNRLIPESVSSCLLRVFAPRDKYQAAKFPAYYSWCRGPSRRMLRRFESLGYEVIQFRGFFGHNYFNRVPLLRQLHRGLTSAAVRYPLPSLTSYAFLVVRKPVAAGE